MPAPSPCCNPGDPETVTLVPGTQGEPGTDGADGTDGVNAFTVTTADFTVPAIGNSVIVLVADSTWATFGQNVFVQGAGYFQVTGKPSSTALTLTYLNYAGNASTGNNIVTGAQISPAGTQPSVVADLPDPVTDNTTGTSSTTMAAGAGCQTLAFAIQLDALTTAAADLLTNYVLGYAFKILSISFATTTIGAGAAASQVLNLEIGTTNVTGGILTITEAGTDTLGEVTPGTAITGGNTGTATDTLSIEVSAGGTEFTAGSGNILIKIQNMDSANALSTLANTSNDLIAALN